MGSKFPLEVMSAAIEAACTKAPDYAAHVMQIARAIMTDRENRQPTVGHAQGVWDEIGTALALLDDVDVSPKARALIRTALESATGQKAPQYLGGTAAPLKSGERQC